MDSLQWLCFSLSRPETMQTEVTAENHSSVTEFILAGLTERPQIHLPLFLLFLVIYVVTVLGNLGMITLIGLSSHLHTPMYYFLSNLSFIDLCQSTVITPRMLVNFVTEEHHLLPWMHDSALRLSSFYYCRGLPVGCNGIWPLCCHL